MREIDIFLSRITTIKVTCDFAMGEYAKLKMKNFGYL